MPCRPPPVSGVERGRLGSYVGYACGPFILPWPGSPAPWGEAAPSPLLPVTMVAEAWASPKLRFQEMYLCSELLAPTDTKLRSVGGREAAAGAVGRKPGWSTGLGRPGP